jgi:hypothetical protein
MKPLEHQLPTEIIENIIVTLGELGRDNAKVADDFRNLFAANRRIRDIAYGALRRMDPSVSVYIAERSPGSSDAAKLRSNLLRGLPYLHLRMYSDSERLRKQIERASPENLKALRGLTVELPYGTSLGDPSMMMMPPQIVDPLYRDQILQTFANVHANGSEELTTKVAIPEVRKFGPEVLSFASQLAGAKGSKLGGIEVNLGRYYPTNQDLPRYVDRMTESVKELAAVVTKEGNHLKFIDLGNVPVSADAVDLLFEAADSTHSRLERLTMEEIPVGRSTDVVNHVTRMLERTHNTLKELGICLGCADALTEQSARSLANALGAQTCKLRMVTLTFPFSRPAGESVVRQLGLGLRQALQRPGSQLSSLKFVNLAPGTPVIDALANALQQQSRLDTLILDKVRSLDGIGQYDQQGTLAHAIAQPQSTLRRLEITNSTLDRGQIFALVEAALQPKSELRSINLRGSYLWIEAEHRKLMPLTQGDLSYIRNILQRQKPALHIEVD